MVDSTRCPRCGNVFDSAQSTELLEGICPHCLAGISGNESQVQLSGPIPPLPAVQAFAAFFPVTVGSTFRGLEVLELLGQGGMGVVYKARHSGLSRLVALKILSPQYAASEEFIRRFEREAKTLASLNHPNIVQIYDFGREGGTCFLAMEYVDGENLETLLEKKPPLNLKVFLNLLKGVARGLQKVHSSGLVHRDIKPANILIAQDGTPKIGDFGLALDPENSGKVTETGYFVGTPHYVSPEHVQGKKVDGRSDLYALGIILYQGVSGRTPFSGPSPTSILMKHVNEIPPPLYKFAPNAPPFLGEITRKLLAKNPAVRHASALELERDLDRVLEGISTQGERREGMAATGNLAKARLRSSEAPPTGSSARPIWLYVGAGGAGLGVLALVSILLFARGKDDAPGRSNSEAGDVSSSGARPERRPASPPSPPVEPSRESVAASRDPRPSPADPQPAPAPSEPPRPEGGVDPDSARELSALNPQERRRRLDHYSSVINLAGIAAAYADRRDLTEEATKLRQSMSQTSEKIALLVALMTREGQNAYVDDALRPTDRLTTFENQDLEQIGKPLAIVLLGNFVSKIKAGSRARIGVLRGGKSEEFVARFDERQKELLTILQVVGLIPGEELQVATSPPTSSPRPAPAAPQAPTSAVKPQVAAVPGVGVAPPAPVKSPLPDSASCAEAERLVREIFKDDYARKSAEDRAALGKKLLVQGKSTQDNGPEAFALLKQAREEAAQGGDAITMLAAISELARRFEVNESELKGTSLALLAKAAKSPEEHEAVARAYIQLADEEMARGNYDQADRAIASGGPAAKKSKLIPLVAKFEAREKECARFRSRSEIYRKAMETLVGRPGDAEAHFVVGMQLCLTGKDWPGGLAHLSQGSDSEVRKLALRDLGAPSDPAEQLAIADGWWGLAEKQEGQARLSLQRRAWTWYERALPGLSGFNKTKAERRLEKSK